MITNIKTFINSILPVKIGDLLCSENPKRYVRYSYNIVCGKNEMFEKLSVINIHNLESYNRNFDLTYWDYKYYYNTHKCKIYKIEDIKIEDIKFMLKILINDNSDDRKKLFGNVIDAWIKRYPIVKELAENITSEIELKKNIDKFNI